jgi:hypothetical protein
MDTHPDGASLYQLEGEAAMCPNLLAPAKGWWPVVTTLLLLLLFW